MTCRHSAPMKSRGRAELKMRRRVSQFFFCALGVFVCALTALALAPAARAQGGEAARGWAGVRTPHFLVLGEAGGREVARAAGRLELYRAAFVRLLPPDYFDRQKPTTVILFRDDASFAPFKPLLGGRRAVSVSGYFQPGAEANYIAAVLDTGHSDSTLLHEYAHLLVNNYFGGAPLWLKEGMAEYYSTARLSGDQRRLTLGAPARERARLLRRQTLIPLRVLFEAGQDSPYYTEPERRALFYAQSWALVHYLTHGGGPARREQFARFLELLSSGAEVGEALRAALGQTAEEVERGLRAYAAAGRFGERVEALGGAAEGEAKSEAAFEAGPVARALLLTHFGDLLVQTGRRDEAETYLTEALALDPALGQANLKLGALRLRQGRHAEAVALLRRAADADPRDHLALYHLADALDREGLGMTAEDLSVRGFEEKTELIRGLLGRALELAPEFVEAYRLLAEVEIERGGRPEEAAALVRRALALAPRRQDLLLVLAHASLSRDDFSEARRIAASGPARSADPLLRARADELLRRVAAREETAARLRAREEESARREAEEVGPVQPCDMPAPGPFHKRLRFKGEQACGRLVEVVCDDAGVRFIVEAGGRALRLRAESFRRVRLVTYTTEVRGSLACGPRERAEQVLVTYRPRRTDSPDESDGEALAVEFIPPDWNH
jgi:tetratricopeptide (TPR) repeat protein